MALTGANIQTACHLRIGTSSGGDDDTVILDILQGVLQEVYDRYPWSWRIRHWEATTQAPYTTGTVTITAGSTAVAGTSTVWTGITDYTSAEDPFFLGVGNEFHRIDSITNDTNLVLKSAVDSAHTAASYGIYRPWVALDASVKALFNVNIYPYATLKNWSLADCQREFKVWHTSSMPVAWAWAPDQSDKVRRIAIFPFLTEAKHLTISGMLEVPTLSANSVELLCPDEFKACLVSGVLAEWYATRDDVPQAVQQNLAFFERKLASLWEADPRPRDVPPVSRWHGQEFNFHVTQEFWNTSS